LYTYAVSKKLASKSESAFINAGFWGALAFGRLLAIPISIVLSAEKMLIINLAGCVGSIILVLAISSSKIVLWIGTIGYGLCMASCFPTAFNLAKSYMNVSGKAASIFVIGASVGEMVVPLTTAYLLVALGFSSLWWVLLISTLLGTVAFALLVWKGRSSEYFIAKQTNFVRVVTQEKTETDDTKAVELEEVNLINQEGEEEINEHTIQ